MKNKEELTQSTIEWIREKKEEGSELTQDQMYYVMSIIQGLMRFPSYAIKVLKELQPDNKD